MDDEKAERADTTGDGGPVPWLAPDEVRAWLLLSALMEALPPAISSGLKRESGVNGFDYMVMAGLSEAPGRAALMSDLAAFVAGSISRLSHALTRMEDRGWVERRPFAGDGRQTEVVLTDAGTALVVAAAPGHVRTVRELVVDPLGPEKMVQLGDLVAQVLEVVNPEILRVLATTYPHDGS
ncbi:transcriptional regulator [Sanguibacter keddieii DSM 10542]|uniref:Transcriptional regulator n=1 Tax=Sanguibacter keddieii (strain ATCC 51767 / DSM 10542 / NCFB 3025 / ST-74) TaxID=446469 RepID=D1BDS5_SANKS|nr:MarR family transcriptional regulator [Sanguibacter keddieii]ACZ21137.1 transcriptional regulator [Sanguibacter keddieii DSM 10542]